MSSFPGGPREWSALLGLDVHDGNSSSCFRRGLFPLYLLFKFVSLLFAEVLACALREKLEDLCTFFIIADEVR